ncbi:hypothetical protein C3454_19440 [Citrobacter europaeus]|nr:hypothetical protein MC47_000245 [Citrobacter freundii]ROW34479.1 hypothetical protein C3454_19440 [Citrobacter europaeus]
MFHLGTKRILRIASHLVNAFSHVFNRLLQKSPEWPFSYGKRTNYARQRQLPPFFCTRSRRDS